VIGFNILACIIQVRRIDVRAAEAPAWVRGACEERVDAGRANSDVYAFYKPIRVWILRERWVCGGEEALNVFDVLIARNILVSGL